MIVFSVKILLLIQFQTEYFFPFQVTLQFVEVKKCTRRKIVHETLLNF